MKTTISKEQLCPLGQGCFAVMCIFWKKNGHIYDKRCFTGGNDMGVYITVLSLLLLAATLLMLAQNKKNGTNMPAATGRKVAGRIIVFADLHYMNQQEWNMTISYDYGKIDAVILLGDICRAYARQIRKAVPEWIPVLYVLGNHDVWDEYEGIAGMTCLDGRTATVGKGIRFAGLSGGTRYKPAPDMAMRTQKEAEKILRGLPAADILVTHASPYRMFADDDAHEGFREIDSYLSRCRPVYHLFGHNHIPHVEKKGQTTCICIFRCAELDLGAGKLKEIF